MSSHAVVEHWSRCFAVVGSFPRAALGFQDVVRLQRVGLTDRVTRTEFERL